MICSIGALHEFSEEDWVCHAGELGLAEPTPPEGASEEVKKAFSANTAGLNDVLELRHISIASSHMADDDVDPEYVCPICLVSAPEGLL